MVDSGWNSSYQNRVPDGNSDNRHKRTFVRGQLAVSRLCFCIGWHFVFIDQFSRTSGSR